MKKLRVSVTSHDYHFPKELYRPLRDEVDYLGWPKGSQVSWEALAPHLDAIDILHVHWPEMTFGFSAEQHSRAIEILHRAGKAIVWSVHDALPHQLGEAGAGVYGLWAAAADGVIHHSLWGKGEIERRYVFNPAAQHRVIYHPAWRRKLVSKGAGSRAEAEAHFGLPPARLRIGLHGSPRAAKDVQLALDGFAACRRTDIQLFISSLQSEDLPPDSRIVALPHRWRGREEFKLLLQAIDVFLLPFKAGESSLTTGLPFDAIALGRPMLASDFPYFHEVLGEAPIYYGSTRQELTACLENLSDEALARAAQRSEALRDRYSWQTAASETWELLRAVAGR